MRGSCGLPLQRPVAHDAVGDEVQELGVADALRLEVDHDAVLLDAVEADLDLAVMQGRRRLVALSVEGKCVVLLDLAGVLAIKEFVCHLVRRQVAYAPVVEREPVDGLHSGG